MFETQHAKRQPSSFPNTPLQQRGNTAPYRTSSKKGSRHCPETAVQNKEMSMAFSSGRMVAPKTRTRVAAQQAAGNLPYFGVDDPLEIQRLRPVSAEKMQTISNFQLDGPENSLVQMNRVTLCNEMDVWRTSGTLMMVTSSVIRSWCRPTYMNLMMPTTGLEQSGIRRKQKYLLENLNAAPLEWKIDDVRSLASVSTAAAGSNTLGVAVGPRQFITDQLLAKADVIRAMHERVQDPQTECALFRESRINHILSVHGHTILQERRAAEIFDEVGPRSFERLFSGFTEDSLEPATPSAGQSGIGPLVFRLATVVEAATATYLEALDGEDKATAKTIHSEGSPGSGRSTAANS